METTEVFTWLQKERKKWIKQYFSSFSLWNHSVFHSGKLKILQFYFAAVCKVGAFIKTVIAGNSTSCCGCKQVLGAYQNGTFRTEVVSRKSNNDGKLLSEFVTSSLDECYLLVYLGTLGPLELSYHLLTLLLLPRCWLRITPSHPEATSLSDGFALPWKLFDVCLRHTAARSLISCPALGEDTVWLYGPATAAHSHSPSKKRGGKIKFHPLLHASQSLLTARVAPNEDPEMWWCSFFYFSLQWILSLHSNGNV